MSFDESMLNQKNLMPNNEKINPIEEIISDFENVAGRMTRGDIEEAVKMCEDCE